MTKYSCERLPEFFDKWGVPASYTADWLSVGRASGGFDNVFGVQIHHGADSPKTALNTSVTYNSKTGPDAPIGNGTVSRDKDGPIVAMYAGLAANTAGKGGPRLTSRGVIPIDSANHITFAFEAENNGVDEPWSDAMCDLYVRATVAVLDWANNCTPGAPLSAGDVFAHFEWSPGRKIDPSGPSRFAPSGGKWNMDQFRGEVFAVMVGSVPPGPPPPAPDVPVTSYVVQAGDGWWKVSRALGYPIAQLQAYNGMTAQTVLHPGMVITAPGAAPAPPQPQPCGQPPTSGLGDSGDDVVELQTLLKADGWYNYNVDGQYGPRTEQAVQKMQRFLADSGQNPGPVDGQYGDQTRGALCAFMGTP